MIFGDDHHDDGAQLPRAEETSGEANGGEEQVSTSISNAQRLRALQPHGSDFRAKHPRRSRLIRWVAASAILFGATGVALISIELATPESLELNAFAAACFILTGVAGAVLCIEWMLADREEFYRRGKLDGWLEGWRGLPPDSDDPLLRH